MPKLPNGERRLGDIHGPVGWDEPHHPTPCESCNLELLGDIGLVYCMMAQWLAWDSLHPFTAVIRLPVQTPAVTNDFLFVWSGEGC